MKENKALVVQNLSHRAQDCLHFPRFHKKMVQNLEADLLKWNFFLERTQENDLQSDKIVDLSYCYPPASEVEKLFLEAIARLIAGKSILFFEKLSFRELENFLRDENHLPAFPSSSPSQTEDIYENTYKEIKNSLLASIILKKINNSPDEVVTKKLWIDLSLVAKNYAIKEVVSLVNRLFPKLKGLELVLVQEEEIFLLMNECPLSLEVFEKVFNERYRFTNEKTSFKVVAVQ